MAFLLSALGGITGVWAAFSTTELLVSLIGIILLFRFQNKVGKPTSTPELWNKKMQKH